MSGVGGSSARRATRRGSRSRSGRSGASADPGVLTDLTGLILLLPPVRARVRSIVARRVHAAIERRLRNGNIFVTGGFAGRSPLEDGPFEIIDADEISRPDRR